jgi:hypothetical protein
MSCHCLIEGVTLDKQEKVCVECCSVNIPNWRSKSREEPLHPQLAQQV